MFLFFSGIFRKDSSILIQFSLNGIKRKSYWKEFRYTSSILLHRQWWLLKLCNILYKTFFSCRMFKKHLSLNTFYIFIFSTKTKKLWETLHFLSVIQFSLRKLPLMQTSFRNVCSTYSNCQGRAFCENS